MPAAFAKAGAKPWVTLKSAGAKLKKTEAIVHQIAGPVQGRLLTILRAPVGQKEVIGADGVIRAVPDAEGGKDVESLELNVTGLGEGKFYDIRKQTLLNVVDGKIKIEMPHGAGYPIAILPYAVTALTAKAAIADRTLNIEWALNSAANAFTTHIVRLEVLDKKSGAPLEHFCRNLKSDSSGKGTVSIPLASEDSGREFNLQLRDVLSGQQTQVEIRN